MVWGYGSPDQPPQGAGAFDRLWLLRNKKGRRPDRNMSNTCGDGHQCCWHFGLKEAWTFKFLLMHTETNLMTRRHCPLNLTEALSVSSGRCCHCFPRQFPYCAVNSDNPSRRVFPISHSTVQTVQAQQRLYDQEWNHNPFWKYQRTTTLKKRGSCYDVWNIKANENIYR